MANTLLIVDDSRTVTTAVQWIFRNTEWTVLVAASGEEGRQQAAAHDPDIILIDYQLPDGSGVDLCQAFRNDPNLAAARLIVLGGSWHPYDENEAIVAGAHAQLLKPFRAEALIEAIDSALAASDAPPPPPGETPQVQELDEPFIDDEPDVASADDDIVFMLDDEDELGQDEDDVEISFADEDDGHAAVDDEMFIDEPEHRFDADAETGEVNVAEITAEGQLDGEGFAVDQVEAAPELDATHGDGSPDIEAAEPEQEERRSVLPPPASRIPRPETGTMRIPAPLPRPGGLRPGGPMVPPPRSRPPRTEQETTDQPALAAAEEVSLREAEQAAPGPPVTPAPVEQAAPEEIAGVPAAAVAVDPEELRRIVREELPSIVRELLAQLLKEQLAERVASYSQARIDAFIEKELPALAERKLKASLDQ